MQYEQPYIDGHYHNILNGFSPFICRGETYLGKHVSSKILFLTNNYTFSLKQKYKEMGIFNSFELLQSAISKGLWDKTKDLEIDLLKKQLERKVEVLGKLALPSQVKTTQAEIKGLERQIREKEGHRMSLCVNSIEQKVIKDEKDYFMYLCVHKMDMTRKWDNFDDFLNEDEDFVRDIGEAYFKMLSEITTSVIRAIVKQTDAKFRLKNIDMGHDVSYYLLELRQWAEFYENIYQLDDKPHTSVLNDDEKLDAWLVGRRAKSEMAKSVNNSNGGTVFQGVMGATAEDMEAIGGVSGKEAIRLSQK